MKSKGMVSYRLSWVGIVRPLGGITAPMGSRPVTGPQISPMPLTWPMGLDELDALSLRILIYVGTCGN